MILDTNALSAIAEGEPAAVAIIEQALEVFLPVVVIGEYRYGIRQSRHKLRYEEWLRRMIPKSGILNIDLRTADEYALIRLELRLRGLPIPANDAWIAALARQHDQPVLSRDRHYEAISALRRIAR